METQPNFNFNQFDIKLETETIGRNFLYFNEIDSTNSVLMSKTSKDVNGTVVFAEKQLKGKGRFSNSWESEKGQNLTFSILLNIDKHLKDKLNYLNLGTAQVLASTIESLFHLQVEVKWPNDILIKRKKAAGILVETLSLGADIKKAVIGIGLNVNQTKFLEEYNYPPTSLKLELNQQVEREKILAEFLNNFEELLWKIRNKPNTIMQSWREKCDMIGEKICLNQNGKLIYGVFDDIDENGQLLLRTEDRIEVMNFGDVRMVN
ncbi:MAG: biotin--[acetyl-CoA-carboxylase] ligase [Ignavibacteria bacterium CG08_land_8_20_14_0_20_37_9]|nr:MAG: biotin--[acetyl-CoA-carboxylase] ligase [Ignavibacteria bacterium CG08_land_8_20_14_0_20_37_9]PJC57091.1 MAG: biotin--[acetyl-CoA-carboxylase] ligase [Ignavibacteria bacterium CG_4_9_14_0_2_um_filter_37_13]